MRKGIAIPVVLAFLTTLGILGIFIFQTMRHQSRQNITNLNQVQAHFLARAGMEHALLKVKYLQRELYDAACLAQGRSPLFDFSRNLDPLTNPGPIFLYHKGDASPSPDSFLTPNLEKIFESRPNPPRTWLNSFMSDLNSGTELSLGFGKKVKVNNVMGFNPLPENIKALMKHQYKDGKYEITTLDLVAQEIKDSKSKVLNQTVVEISVKADLTSYLGENWVQNLKRTVRISRDSQF